MVELICVYHFYFLFITHGCLAVIFVIAISWILSALLSQSSDLNTTYAANTMSKLLYMSSQVILLDIYLHLSLGLITYM
jgi:hypothetical protein